ncbi:MAG: 3-dehydroquinate dehydratase [Lachnospiraceae bacterium]|nr:3-dehydroquinate dehydratase [Lachnospiraceae bacterium]MCI9183581.1 3-dehydroquinate dehydratase [Lachnospiraceae bacterium]
MGEKKVLVVNGANMDLLGKRDPGAFGADTLDILMGELVEYGKEMGVQVSLFQSNVEGEVINILHEAMGQYDGVIMNPGSFGHYSIGIKEAIDAMPIPCIEVHLANFYRKPENKSVLAPVCRGLVCGFGRDTYKTALDGMLKITG